MPDNLTASQRSYCVSRVRGKDTGIERAVRSELHRRGLRYIKHDRRLPGVPDVVFTKARVVVFIDGDFWHGYRFARWQADLSEFWKQKISNTISRDRRNQAKLRREGWKVIRLWQHQVEKDLERCVERICSAVAECRTGSTNDSLH